MKEGNWSLEEEQYLEGKKKQITSRRMLIAFTPCYPDILEGGLIILIPKRERLIFS